MLFILCVIIVETFSVIPPKRALRPNLYNKKKTLLSRDITENAPRRGVVTPAKSQNGLHLNNALQENCLQQIQIRLNDIDFI